MYKKKYNSMLKKTRGISYDKYKRRYGKEYEKRIDNEAIQCMLYDDFISYIPTLITNLVIIYIQRTPERATTSRIAKRDSITVTNIIMPSNIDEDKSYVVAGIINTDNNHFKVLSCNNITDKRHTKSNW